jgi:tetratricopeptide (TPR) repeat protein
MSGRLALTVFYLLLPGLLAAQTYLVLPFVNLSPKPALGWVGESVAESLREAMTREGMLVVEREDRLEGERRLALRPNVRLTQASILKLAESLDADRVIFGSFEITESDSPGQMGQLKLTARSINVRELQSGSEYTASGAMEDLASLQSNLAWQTLQMFLPKTAPSEEAFLQSRARLRIDAVENYVRGLLATTPEARERFFQQALKLEPKYSQAAFQHGKLLFDKGSHVPAIAQLEKVQAWDSHYREAGFLLGLAKFYHSDFKGAEAAFERVAKELPLSEVYNNLGIVQLRLNSPEALMNLRRALEGDDKDPVYHYNNGLALLRRGAYPEAAEEFRAVLAREPGDQDATKMLGRALRPSATPVEDAASIGRLKFEMAEAAYWQLKALMSKKK